MGAPAGPAVTWSPALVGTLWILSGAISILQANGAPREVNEIVGGSALLSFSVPRDLHVVDDVRWKYGPEKVRLGDSKGKIFKPFNLSQTNYNQLIQRLDMYNETTLQINDLTKGDGGIYKADVPFSDLSTNEEEFLLNVYDPVPVPVIKIKKTTTTQGCNFTLECLVPSEKDLVIKCLVWYPDRSIMLTADGGKLNFSLDYNRSSYECLCVVENPVDQKNASKSLTCLEGSEQIYLAISPSIRAIVIVAVMIIVIIVIIVICSCKNKRPSNREAVPQEAPPDVSNETDDGTEEAGNVNGKSEVRNGIDQAYRHSENSQQNGCKEEDLTLRPLRS